MSSPPVLEQPGTIIGRAAEEEENPEFSVSERGRSGRSLSQDDGDAPSLLPVDDDSGRGESKDSPIKRSDKRKTTAMSTASSRQRRQFKAAGEPPVTPVMAPTPDGKCCVENCDRGCVEGYIACCRTCKRTDGRMHGPSCGKRGGRLSSISADSKVGVKENDGVVLNVESVRPSPQIQRDLEPVQEVAKSREPAAFDAMEEGEYKKDGEEAPQAGSAEAGDDGSECSLVDQEEMMLIAKQHQMETACTRLNEDGEFEFLDVWRTPIFELGEYGPGVMLYFEWLKWMGIFFSIMLLASMPMIIISSMGDFVEEVLAEDGGIVPDFQKDLAKFTLGNIGACGESYHCMDATSRSLRMLTANSTTRLRDVTIWLGLNDVIVLVIFLIGIQWFRRFHTPYLVARVDEENVTASDYSVRVDNLPTRLGRKSGPLDPAHLQYETKLKQHFEHLVIHELCPDTTEEAVVKELVVVRQFEGAFQIYQAQGELLLQVENQKKRIAELKWKMSHGCGNPQEKRKLEKWIVDVIKSREKAMHQIDVYEEQLEKHEKPAEERDVCGAFVIFERETYKDAVIAAYANSGGTFVDEAYLFEGKKLRVKQAPEPMDVMWENMDVPKSQSTRMRYLTSCFSFVVVCACALGVLTLRSVPVDVKFDPTSDLWWTLYNSSYCWGLDNVKFYSDSRCTENKELTNFTCLDQNGVEVEDEATCREQLSSFQSASCERHNGTAHGVAVRFNPSQTVNCVKVDLRAGFQVEMIRFASCPNFAPQNITQPSWSVSSSCSMYRPVVLPEEPLSTDGETLEIIRATETELKCSRYPDMAADQAKEAVRVVRDLVRDSGSKREREVRVAFHPRISCYCKPQIGKRGLLWTWFGRSSSEDDKMVYGTCKEFLDSYKWKVIRSSASSVVVVLGNQILLFLFYYIDKLNVHKSRTGLASGQLIELWFSQTLITGIMVILASQNFHNTLDKLGFRPKGEYYDDFNSSWFMMAGSNCFLVIGCQAASAAGFGVAWILTVDRLLRWFFSRGILQQQLLNEVCQYPEWTVASRFAESLTVVFCVLMFSGIIPLLYAIGALYCLAAYWLDKWSLLRGSCKPPGYDTSMVRTATKICRAAVLAHLIVVIWAFSYQELFPSDWGPLKKFFLSLWAYQLSPYEEIMAVFDSHGDTTTGTNGHYFKARLVDFGRQGCLVPVVMSIPYVAYYTYSLIWLVLRPFTKNVRGYLKNMRRNAKTKFSHAATGALSSAGVSSSWIKTSTLSFRGRSTAETYSEVAKAKSIHHRVSLHSGGCIGGEDADRHGNVNTPDTGGVGKNGRRPSVVSGVASLTSAISRPDMPVTEKGYCMSYDMKWHPKYARAYEALFYVGGANDAGAARVGRDGLQSASETTTSQPAAIPEPEEGRIEHI